MSKLKFIIGLLLVGLAVFIVAFIFSGLGTATLFIGTDFNEDKFDMLWTVLGIGSGVLFILGLTLIVKAYKKRSY